jgi:hypothetical protein
MKIPVATQPSFCYNRLHLILDGSMLWIAVHTHRVKGITREVTRPIVPLPEGSGTKVGDDGLVGAMATV